MASSILTNTSAMTALQNLAASQKALTATQAQVSSGLRVSTASDDAAYWSIASTLRSDTGALSAVSDALALGASVVGTAAAAIASALTLLGRIKADLVTAQQPGTSLAAVQTDIAAQQRSLTAVLSSASFNGVNLLDGTAGTSPADDADDDDPEDDPDDIDAPVAVEIGASPSPGFIRPMPHPPIIIAPIEDTIAVDRTLTFVVSFGRSAGGATSLGTVSLDTTATNLVGAGGVLTGAPGGGGSTDILGMDITAAGFNLATAAADVGAAIASTLAAGAAVGGVGTTVANQRAYISALSNAAQSGMGALVDADMDVASTRLQALQVRQQLGVQALSVANGNGRLILALFQAA